MDTYQFGRFVAERRKELNMTQRDLAAKIQVTDKAVSRWERGLGFPDITTIEDLANALDVSITELMRSERTTEQISAAETEAVVTEVVQAAGADLEERRRLIAYTFAGTTVLLSVLEILLSIQWDAARLQLSAGIPYIAVLPGILMILYGIFCRIRGKKTHGIWALGICLLLVPVILLGAAFLILGLFTG